MVMHHNGSLRLAGMVVDNSLKVVFGRDDAEPVGSDNQKIGIHKRQVTNHSLEVVAAMTAENNQLTHALCIEGGNYVFQNGLLGGIAGMDAERKFALPRIVCTERYGRHHHTAYTGILQSQCSRVYSNVMRQNTISEIRQMQIVGLRSSPRQDDNVILHSFHLSIAGNSKVNFSFFHDSLFWG